MTWEWRRQDKATVLDCLKEGQYEAIMTSAQGPLDGLAHVAVEMGVLDAAVQKFKVKRKRNGIYDHLFFRTIPVLPFIEADSLRGATEALFKDASILLQLGYTAVQIREGFNDRYHNEQGVKSEESLPYHPETLREEMKRITVESVAAFRHQHIRDLFQRRLVLGTTYAIDGSGLGDKWRLVVLLNVHAERPLVVNWRLLPATASEKGKEITVVREMIDEVREIAGSQAIAWLIMDALYADGPALAILKYHYGIDAMVRCPEDREIFVDMQGIVAQEPDRWETHSDVRYVAGQKQQRTVSTAAVEELTTWDSFLEKAQELGVKDAQLWGCLIHDRPAGSDQDSEDWSLVSTRPFATGWKGYKHWRQRWCVENNCFREFKEGWKLEKTRWGRSLNVIAVRCAVTCSALNVAQVAKSKAGERLLHTGIRRLRREMVREYGPAPVIVYAGGCYAIFHIEEIMQALGRPPAESLRPALLAKNDLRRQPRPYIFRSD